MCNEIFTHVVSDHTSSEEKHDFSNKDDDTDTIVTHILYHLKDNSKNIIGILTCESGELFPSIFQAIPEWCFHGVFRGADRAIKRNAVRPTTYTNFFELC
ncbi:MAG: hypothetical protein BWY11_02293 [Firmicutes bacterium ADurb.Bin182]|nr:MAG: hypothetical protein BWY11_02293 [Firmicutes bacterium ADurb.Bin182]